MKNGCIPGVEMAWSWNKQDKGKIKDLTMLLIIAKIQKYKTK